MKENNASLQYRTAFIIITVLFFLWGFTTVLIDSLIPHLIRLFDLTYFQAGLVQFAFFAAYFILSIPASSILSVIGYKKGIVVGLCTMAIGCFLFYPAASYREFGIFIAANFVLAAGITVLQVAANPYVTVLGSSEGASSRLNLSQAFNSLGTAIAPIFGAAFILSDAVKSQDEINALSTQAKEVYLASEADAVQRPFLYLGIFILCIATYFVFTRLPKVMDEKSKGKYFDLFKHRNLMLGVVGIFFYVGSEVAIGSYVVNYFLSMNIDELIMNNSFMRSISAALLSTGIEHSDGAAIVGVFATFYWSGAMIGRFIGSYLTRVFKPAIVLCCFAACAIILLLISMNSIGFLSMWSILCVGLFNSIMFPTIFALAIDDLDDLKPLASGLLCTAIVGGAVIPPLYGLLTDNFGFKMALFLLIFCYGYIFYYGNWKRGRKTVRS